MNENSLKVFIAKIPEIMDYKPIYPENRWKEIINCSSEKVKKEKYVVWQLLKFVLEKKYKIKFEDIVFSKTENGKWLAERLYFSLSHTDDFAAVCIDSGPIGLDIEALDGDEMTKSIFRYITTYKERTKCINPSPVDVATLWTKKEAIFKYLGKDFFSPHKIETEDYLTSTIVSDKFDIAVSVCGTVKPIEIVTIDLG